MTNSTGESPGEYVEGHAMVGNGETVGLIAGTGDLPELFAKTIADRGDRVVVIAAVNDAFATGEADAIHRIFLGEWQRLITTLKQSSVRRVYVTGKFQREQLNNGGLFDGRFQRVMASLLERFGGAPSDDQLMLSYSQDLEHDGLTVAPVADYLSHYFVKPGVLGRHIPTGQNSADIFRAYEIAKAIASVQAGQTALVKAGVVLAIEACDGTDETIKRAGMIGGAGAVAVKVARPDQDRRFDLPVIGLSTVAAAVHSGVSVLAFESDETLVIDRDEAIALADNHGMSLVAYDPGMEKHWID